MQCKGETMRIVTLDDLKEDKRADMQGARWLVLAASEIEHSASLLMFTELDDILVAVDHRGSIPSDGLWQRAVHLILVDGSEGEAENFRRRSGITKVIANVNEDIRTFLWQWVWRDLNPRSTPCKGGVITTRPQTQPSL